MEEWRDIVGYEGLYQISNTGKVRSLRFGRIIELKQGIKKNGYHFVILCVDNLKKSMHIHRLVGEAFVPNPNGYKYIHHKDHNPGNNNAENIEWISEENHRELHGIGDKSVYQYDLDGNLIKEWKSAKETGRELGINQSHISDCCRGGFYDKRRNKWINIKQYKGYRWSYKPL